MAKLETTDKEIRVAETLGDSHELSFVTRTQGRDRIRGIVIIESKPYGKQIYIPREEALEMATRIVEYEGMKVMKAVGT